MKIKKISLIAALGSVVLLAQTKDLRVAVAASQGDGDAVAALIKQRADVNTAQGDGMTALHWAAFKDDLALTRTLLAAGANVKAATRNDSVTPIIIASETGNAT